MYVLGIDVGSASSKAVILDGDKQVVASQVVALGTGSTGPSRVLELALEQAGLAMEGISTAVATGYGRLSIPFAEKQLSEITCHARGIAHLFPAARTVIDIGGQDAKAIRLGPGGMVQQFFMNDKCAAGTGRFLEVMARVLEIPLGEMEQWHEKATAPATISSTCTVFAESEVISQLSAGTPKADIIAGVHRSVASKACSLAFRGGVEPAVVMSGGVAQNKGVVTSIAETLGMEVLVAPDPQAVGALGAALCALELAMGAA